MLSLMMQDMLCCKYMALEHIKRESEICVLQTALLLAIAGWLVYVMKVQTISW